MLDRNIVTLSRKNNKFEKQSEKLMKYLGLPFTPFLRCDDPSLEFSTTSGYTLIPRTMTTNIIVCAINVDIWMDVSQRQQARVFYHGSRATDERTISNNMGDDIHVAACNGNVIGVQELVHKNKELIRQKDLQGNLPLHLAVEKGHREAALYLIEEFPQGSYALNQFEKSPLYLAVVNGHKDLLADMLENLANDDKATSRLLKKGRSIIFAAITAQSQDMVQIILKHQPKLIKSTNKEGWTPLSCAAYNGLGDIVYFILENFPESVHKDASYPIHKACLGGHVSVLEMFHSHSPKYFTKPNQEGRNILHLAAEEPHNRLKDVVSYLLSLRESRKLIKMKDDTNRTPFDLAKSSSNDEVMELFA